jgi:Kef-type K+ transport system membrane component KefB
MPVLGRILLEFGLTRTRLGVLAISAAAVDDALGWILLAGVSASVVGQFRLAVVAQMLAWTLVFVLATFFLVRPLIVAWIPRVLGPDATLGLVPLSVILLAVLSSALITGSIGIFAIFGPFVLGAALWDQGHLRQALIPRLQDLVNALFLPVFFTYTGLRTNIGLLDGALMWGLAALVTLTAIVGKTVGCGLAGRLSGLSWRESAAVAALMNTRALMGLVAINIGRDLGIVPDSVFAMLVIMALVTTLMTSPLLRWLVPEPERA